MVVKEYGKTNKDTIILLHGGGLSWWNYEEVAELLQDEYHIIKNNPFRGPSDKRVLRIDTGSSVIELISKYTIQSYFIKYLSKPKPIILQDITDENLSINGETKRMGCELNTVLHRTILERAVSLAIKRLPSKNV